ncbi:hypothetical protein QQP08_000826 [Theobroma cacao]|nr:hypothetical protein QQP08_000826 [Theobroma cacao]
MGSENRKWEKKDSDSNFGLLYVFSVKTYRTVNATRLNVWHGDNVIQRIGFWDGNGIRFFFHSSPESYNFSFVSNTNEVCSTFSNKGDKSSSWFVLVSTGDIEEYIMLDEGVKLIPNKSKY